MAKYVKAMPAPVPVMRLESVTLWGVFLGLAGIFSGVMPALFPEARNVLWSFAALSAAGVVGIGAYYLIERAKFQHHGRTLIASIGCAAATFFAGLCMAGFVDGGASSGFSRVPSKHGSLKVAFYGSEKAPTETVGENVYRSSIQCSTLSLDSGPNPQGMWTPMGKLQNCVIFVVWKRPIINQKHSISLDGVSLPVVQKVDPSPYIAVYSLNGIPLTGMVEVSADQK